MTITETIFDHPADTLLPIHTILGELNTEAKCAVYLSAPPNDSPPSSTEDIVKSLDRAGAFAIERGKNRFKVHGIAKELGSKLLEVTTDHVNDTRHNTLVRQRPNPIGLLGAAVAGSMLEFSCGYGLSPRLVVGEKCSKRKTISTDTILIRLAVMGALADVFRETGSESFRTSIISNRVHDELGVHYSVVASHIRKLKENGLLASHEDLRRLARFTTLSNGRTSGEAILEIANRTTDLKIGNKANLEKLAVSGKRIVSNPQKLPVLIRRSYKSSTHTDKGSARET